MAQAFTNWFMTIISIVTAMGVFMHDGRVDKAAMTALGESVLARTSKAPLSKLVADFVQTDAHTHPDHNAAKNLLSNSFAYQSPTVPPRNREERKNRLQMPEDVGRHAFDDAHMPIIA